VLNVIDAFGLSLGTWGWSSLSEKESYCWLQIIESLMFKECDSDS
jgi:hypothetical protein